MFNYASFSYSAAAALLMFLSSIMLYYRVRGYNIRYLKLMCLGLFLQGFLPFVFVPQAFLEGSQYNNLIGNLVIIGADLFLIGSLITVWNLKIHQKAEIPKRYILLVLTIGFELSWMIFGTEAVWTDKGEWVIQRTILIRVVMFLGVGWIIYELFRLFILGILNTESIWMKISLMYPLGISVSYILLALREDLPFPTTFYQIFSAIGASFFILAIYKNPYILILPNIKVNKVILTQNNSGIALLSYPDEDFGLHSASLTSAALTGIGELIKEISGKPDIPPRLGYADYTIGVYQGELNTIYSISNGDHPILGGLLHRVVEKWDCEVTDNGTVTSDKMKSFESDLENQLFLFLPNKK